MQKISTLIVALFMAFGFQQVLADGVQFEHGTWKQALDKAQAEDKFIFLDAYTTWCGPCKWMSANVMTQEKVGSFFNDNFVNVKMDMEKGEGIELAKKYKVGAYPTLAFINGDGEMVWRVAGALEAADFIALGQKVLDGVEPIQKMYDKYDSGKYDRDFLYEYLVHAQEAALPYNDALDAYIEGMKPADLKNDQDFDVFMRFFSNTDSEYFQEFEKNLDTYKKKHGEEKVTEKYYGSFIRTMQRAAYKNDQDAFQRAHNKIKGAEGEELQSQVNNMVIYNVFQNESKEAGYEALNELVRKGKPYPPQGLNHYAWDVYENHDEPDLVDQAITWAAFATEQTNDPMIMDTWGMLLYKKGELKDALEKLEEAVSVAQESGIPMEETEEAIAKIKSEL